ncbi:MAG: dienelactone hydrolase family protein [Puia sp.]|nr:dienelactone hydrolase family protein [Puia sp.]
MTNHDFITIPVADGTEMDVYIAFPEKKGPSPAIIVIQEAYGVNSHIRNVTERLYKEGYVAISPDIFHRTIKRADIPYTDFSAAMPHYQAVTNEGLKADLEALYGWLQKQSAVEHDKIGSIGFCLGGRVSFLANAVLPLSAAISYYGGGLETLTTEAPNLHGAQLFVWGGLDTHITQEKREAILQAVDAAGKKYAYAVFSYAGHAFNSDDRPSYNPEAAKEAWGLSLGFLANNLK